MERFWVTDKVLMIRITFDDDPKHVLDSLTKSVESGSGKRLSVIHVVFDPQRLNVLKSDFARSLQGVDKPDVLSEGVGVSHDEKFRQK